MTDTDAIAAAYDVVAPAYARLLPDMGTETGPEAKPDLDLVQQFAGLVPPGGTVLDAGCGTGRMVPYLEALADLRVEGCDISEGMVARAQAGNPRHRFRVADLAALPYAAQSFDGVTAWYSIIHTAPKQLHSIGTELHRILVPGGVLLMAFHAGEGPRTITGAYGTEVQMTAHLHRVSEVLAVLRQCGFLITASLERAPVAAERHSQGFVLARARLPFRNAERPLPKQGAF